MRADPDMQVGAIFRRLHMMRTLSEPAFERAVQAILTTLGKVALEEAERRARFLAERTGPRPGDLRVRAFADRRTPDPIGDDTDAGA
ncbi:hypothetical protein FF100_26825 [Methylobacterium terricola]|uniref:Uncharacterized protein n=1 Tax=Methylobacterium terricola TaxID=2583531 RepID=A0A5C4LBV5_9HYPH|nr:hypothetical protein [Methylobacterium terricola]TNC09184.1 hypothetical protein FF100_26825 [Methylobacterium terricola]